MDVVPIPDAELFERLGVVAGLLTFLVTSGVVIMALFLRRMVQAMDRMAEAQEMAPAVFAKIEAALAAMDRKLDAIALDSREHVRIARLWEKTEAPGRHVKPD